MSNAFLGTIEWMNTYSFYILFYFHYFYFPAWKIEDSIIRFPVWYLLFDLVDDIVSLNTFDVFLNYGTLPAVLLQLRAQPLHNLLVIFKQVRLRKEQNQIKLRCFQCKRYQKVIWIAHTKTKDQDDTELWSSLNWKQNFSTNTMRCEQTWILQTICQLQFSKWLVEQKRDQLLPKPMTI